MATENPTADSSGLSGSMRPWFSRGRGGGGGGGACNGAGGDGGGGDGAGAVVHDDQ